MRTLRIVLLLGFDRSGTSLIGGLLRKHPQINYLFQPLAYSELQKQQHQLWLPNKRVPIAERYFEGLLAARLDSGCVNRAFLRSEMFVKNSSSRGLLPDKLNAIKETRLHLKVAWIKTRFPQIKIFGIWRHLLGVMCSLMRNDLYRQWYGEPAYQAVLNLIRRAPFRARFRDWLRRPLHTDFQKMALIVAVHSWWLTTHIDRSRFLVYEEVLRHPNETLNSLVKAFGLDDFDFAPYVCEDFNVAGQPFVKTDLWREYFSQDEILWLRNLFEGIEPRVARESEGETAWNQPNSISTR